MQVAKWGNSLAVRLPAAVVEALKLQEGDDIEIQVAGERAFDIKRRASPRELLSRLKKFRGRLPDDFKFDRLDTHERSAVAEPDARARMLALLAQLDRVPERADAFDPLEWDAHGLPR